MDDPLYRPPIVRQVSELIGATPLFELARTESDARLLLKLEQFNPTGTAKIRMARQMVIDAEERGMLRPAAGSSSRPPATPGSAWPSWPPSAATPSPPSSTTTRPSTSCAR